MTDPTATIPQPIYCDESGFTGNNLLHPDQPYFAYASVAISESEAKDFAEPLWEKYRLQAPELKAKTLLRSSPGKSALADILTNMCGQAKVSVYDKHYSLGCKFFEYMFEPVLAKKSSIFYSLGFNQFIANIMYWAALTKQRHVPEFMTEFETTMRRFDVSNLALMLSQLELPGLPAVFQDIRDFCSHNRDLIAEEIETLPDYEGGKWTLDLTQTALFHLLADWGKTYDVLDVFCDDSKPLRHAAPLVEAMIGRTDKISAEHRSVTSPVTFNLKRDLQILSSTESYGIQLADTIAGTVAHLMTRDESSSFHRKWVPRLPEFLGGFSVLPNTDTVDLSTVEVRTNARILAELADRSRRRQPILEGIEDSILDISRISRLE